MLYYGTNRADTFTQKQLESADIVLTTYSILEVDYRRNIMAPKATCTFCGKKFQPERLKVHLRYFCGPWAEKTEAQARQQKKRAPWMMRRGGGGGGKVCWRRLCARSTRMDTRFRACGIQHVHTLGLWWHCTQSRPGRA